MNFFLCLFSFFIILLLVNCYADSIIDNGTCGNNLTWNLYDNGMLVISGQGKMTDYSRDDPSPWNKYKSKLNSSSNLNKFIV